MGLDDFPVAREELSWFWTCADGELGFRAQNYDPSTTGGEWDEDRQATMAFNMFRWERQVTIRRRADVEAIRDRMTPQHWSMLRLVFEPVTEHMLGGPVVHISVKRAFLRGGFPLFMLAVHSPTTLREFAKAHEMDQDAAQALAAESIHRIREWLQVEAQRPGERLSRLQTGAENFVLPAIQAYDLAAREVIAEKEWAKEERASQRKINTGLL